MSCLQFWLCFTMREKMKKCFSNTNHSNQFIFGLDWMLRLSLDRRENLWSGLVWVFDIYLKIITRSITNFLFFLLFPFLIKNHLLKLKIIKKEWKIVFVERIFTSCLAICLRYSLKLEVKTWMFIIKPPKTQCYNEWNPVFLGYNRKQLFLFKWIKPNNLLIYYFNWLIVGEADILFNLWYFCGCIPTTK